MKTLSRDTSPEAEAVLLKLLRQAPVWKRLQMVDQMHETLRLLTIADLRRCYPNADENEIKRRLAARLLSRADVIAAYGWDPQLEGYQVDSTQPMKTPTEVLIEVARAVLVSEGR